MSCPFCGLDPYEYVDVGLGGRGVPVAVTCCEFGQLMFDDRTPDHRWYKAAELVVAELGDMEYGEARMIRAGELFEKYAPTESRNK